MKLEINENIYKALKAASFACSKDQARASLYQTICIKLKDKTIRVEATDGHRLHRIDVYSGHDFDGNLSGLAWSTTADKLKSHEKLIRGAIKFHQQHPMQSLACMEFDELDRWPETDTIIPNDGVGDKIRVNPKYLQDACKACSLITDSLVVQMPADDGQPLMVKAKAEGAEFLAVIMPMRF
jgi:hypothetical protein